MGPLDDWSRLLWFLKNDSKTKHTLSVHHAASGVPMMVLEMKPIVRVDENLKKVENSYKLLYKFAINFLFL